MIDLTALTDQLRTQFSNTLLTTQIGWALLIIIAVSVFYHHKKQHDFRQPLAVLIFIGGAYNILSILMKTKAMVLLNEFEPVFVRSSEMGYPYVEKVINVIWVNGVIRSGMLIAMIIGVAYIMFLRLRRKIYPPTHWVYGLVIGLFVCSLLITKLKFDFESILRTLF